jgi:hypothetical protein
MLPDVGKGYPPYQRRLVAAGLMSRYRLARGITNLTGAGLDLADAVTDRLVAGAARRWDTTTVYHPPVCRDPRTWEFAERMSGNFDSFRLADGDYLWFDTNLAHLDWLREAVGSHPPPLAVASTDGVYRPVADVRPLIRDEYLAPSVGIHLAAIDDQVPDVWRGVLDLVAEVARAAGVPALLVERTPPGHYASRAVAALLPAPTGGLAPWMLAYQLGPAFEEALDRPGMRIVEIGMSSRVLAFAAHLQAGRAAVFASAVSPTQVAFTGPATSADMSRLRVLPYLAGNGPDTISGAAPVRYDAARDTYRLLLEDYRIDHRRDRPLPAVVADADRRLLAARTELLLRYIDANDLRREPTGGPGTVLSGLPGLATGSRLDPGRLG